MCFLITFCNMYLLFGFIARQNFLESLLGVRKCETTLVPGQDEYIEIKKLNKRK